MRFETGGLRKKEHPELTMYLTFDEAEDIFRGLQFWASRDDVGEAGAELELSDDDGRNLVILISARDPDSDPYGVNDPDV
jgi:hypothetical protein